MSFSYWTKKKLLKSNCLHLEFLGLRTESNLIEIVIWYQLWDHEHINYDKAENKIETFLIRKAFWYLVSESWFGLSD